MPESTVCSVLRTPGQLNRLRPQWDVLWRSDPMATPFQSPGWLLPWSQQFVEGSLRIAVVHRSGSLCAVLPFYVYTEPADGCRKLLPLGVATSDYLDGVFSPACKQQDILIALDHLTAHCDWDTLEIPQLRAASRLRSALQSWRPACLLPGCGERVSQLDPVRLSDLPLKIRRNAMYYRNRAARAGTLELTLADAQNWPEALHALKRLHTARWNLTGEPGVLSDPRVCAWHRQAIPQLISEDLVRLYCLRLNGEVIAALYTLVDPPGRASRSVYIYITGFSPGHSDLRPGTVLLALTIDHVARQGFTTVDLLRGNESYKNLWHPRWVATDRFLIDRASAAGDLAA